MPSTSSPVLIDSQAVLTGVSCNIISLPNIATDVDCAETSMVQQKLLWIMQSSPTLGLTEQHAQACLRTEAGEL